MHASEARRKSATGAERSREAAEASRRKAQRAEDDALTNLENHIAVTAMGQTDKIDAAIATATDQGARRVAHVYSERISSSTRTAAEVAYVKAVAGEVATRLVAQFEGEGYTVELSTEDVVDFRDAPTAPPEYHDAHFEVSW